MPHVDKLIGEIKPRVDAATQRVSYDLVERDPTPGMEFNFVPDPPLAATLEAGSYAVEGVLSEREGVSQTAKGAKAWRFLTITGVARRIIVNYQFAPDGAAASTPAATGNNRR